MTSTRKFHHLGGPVVCIQPPVICMLKDDLPSGRPDFKESWSVKGFLAILSVLVLISNANAACSISGGCTGNSGDWESSANAFLNSDVPDSFIPSNALKADVSNEISSDKTTSEKALNNTTAIISEPEAMNYVSTATRSDSFANGGFLEPILGISGSDVVIDATNGNNYSDQPHIKGAIHLPSKSFLYENGTLRPAPELAGILGNAGIARVDRAVIYGDGSAPADTTFVFWVMRYLGLDNAKVLDGGLNDWRSAGLPLESGPIIRKPTGYEPIIRREILANYNYVRSGKAQIVDARTTQEFGKERIPGSISIDSAQVLDNGRIEDSARLNDTFSDLEKDKPVVVYSEDGLNASLIWYALQLMGYNSSLYTWNDWEAHQSTDVFKVSAIKPSSRALINETSKYKKLG